VFAESEAGPDWLGAPVLWAVTRRDIRRRVAEFLEWDLEEMGELRPQYFEHQFGAPADLWIDGVDLGGAPARIRVIGRIDRVDRDPGGSLHIVDYKSGTTPSPKGHADGAALQGPLYLAAIRKALGAEVATAAYLSIKHRKRAAEVTWGDTACERALRIALTIPARVRAGRFEPAAAASCKWVHYWHGADICRVTDALDDGASRFDE
jgi:ATP-dependent helicase/DNAse subunit B